ALDDDALLVIQRAWHEHVGDQPQIAAPPTAQAGHAVPLEHDHGAGLQPGLDLDLLVTVERLDRSRDSQGGLREAEVELADEVEPVAHEALVGAYVHVEIACRRAQLAGVPVARDAHGLAVVDARGNVDPERAPHRAPAAAAAIGTGPLRDLPAPGALAARRRAHELPERRAYDLPDGARALTLLAGEHVRAGCGAI